MTESLAAYLCHELAGQIGTLAATLELGEPAEAFALAQDVAARLRFLRAAWGGGAGALDAGGLAALARGLPGADRCQVDVGGVAGVLDESLCRIALCVLPVAVLALPRGGDIRIAANPVASALSLTLDGTNAGWPAAFASCAAEPEQAWQHTAEPRTLPTALCCLVAHALGHKVIVSDRTHAEIAARISRMPSAPLKGT